MPLVKFSTADEPGFELTPSDTLFAVRTRSQKPLRSKSNVPHPIEAQLADCELVAEFPEAGIQVFRAPASDKPSDVSTRKVTLRRFPDVRFAGGVLIDEQAGEPVLYTENLFVKFRDDVRPESCEKVIRELGLTIKEKPGFSVNGYFVQATEGTGQRVFDLALELLSRDDVVYSHPELVRPKSRKQFFPAQWHLAATMINGMLISNHAHVHRAHELTRGEGVTIAVIDDGIDIEHPELSVPGKVVSPLDVLAETNDPSPGLGDDHGTACAGVACAGGVDGAAGVAPRAKLMPIRLTANLGSLAEAKAFQWAADQGADVISCSWGPPDGRWYNQYDPRHKSAYPLPASTREALDYAIRTGRSGRGCVILFAAGNGNEDIQNDGYASYEKVIAVAACNDRGTRSVYSDKGRAVWCCFPSNDFEFGAESHPEPLTTGIWTTDRRGAAGYNGGDIRDGDEAGLYTNSFGGTSSACPGVAGVVALILAVNPNQTWIDVRKILRCSCDRIDPSNGQYDEDGHSPLYGYGRVNARRAVELSMPVPEERIDLSRTFQEPIRHGRTVEVALDVSDSGTINDIEVSVAIVHSYIGDLVVKLVGPDPAGREILLHAREGGNARNLIRTYRASTHLELSKLVGRSITGKWRLRVEDQAAGDVGTLQSFGLGIRLADDGGVAGQRAALAAAARQPVNKKRTTGSKTTKGRAAPQTKRRKRAKR